MAGAVHLTVKEADLKETLQLLSLRHGLEPPYPELQQPPWVPPNHPLAEARTPPGPETLGLCVTPSRRPPGCRHPPRLPRVHPRTKVRRA